VKSQFAVTLSFRSSYNSKISEMTKNVIKLKTYYMKISLLVLIMKEIR